jgi:hypothetical protein
LWHVVLAALILKEQITARTLAVRLALMVAGLLIHSPANETVMSSQGFPCLLVAP